jgi:membrane protease YdiL (CAAX protease family)
MVVLRRLNPEWRPIILIGGVLYLLAAAYLLALGEVMGVALLAANAVFVGLLLWLTARLTRPLPPEPVAAGESRGRVWAQLGVLAAVIVLTGIGGDRIPLWSAMVNALRGAGEAVLPVEWFGGPGNAVANPVQYFVIPLILLLLLGARLPELGFGRGHRAWRVSLVWFAVPALVLLWPAAVGALGPQTFIRRIISNFFQNGFFEEFLFRGALQTRLNRLLTVPASLGVQALVFGLWHWRGNTAAFDGNALAGLAWCIVSQGFMGLAFGIIFHRTRNLVAPTVAHVMMNVLGQSFG